MTPNDAGDLVVPYLTGAATIVYIQKWLKTRDFYGRFVTAFPGADKWAHRFVAGVGSAIVAIGIHITFMGDLNSGWSFHGTIPDIWTILHSLADWFKVYMMQHWGYDNSKQAPYVNPTVRHETAIDYVAVANAIVVALRRDQNRIPNGG